MKKRVFLAMGLSLSFVLAACGTNTEEAPTGEEVKTPNVSEQTKEENAKIDGVTYVDKAFLKNLLTNTSFTDKTRKSYEDHIAGWSFYLIDVRGETDYNDGHINGALHVSLEELKAGSALLPTKKDEQIILYGKQKNDKVANEAAQALKDAGYENIVVYTDGLDTWAETEYLVVTDDYVKELIADENKKDSYLLINALPTVEFNKAHIPSSISVEDIYFEDYISQLPQDKDFNIVVYCMGFECGKSHNVAEVLLTNGYTNVKVYAAGMLLWNEKNLPVEQGNLEVNAIGTDQIVNASDFLYNAGKAEYLYVDARDVSEYSLGNVKGSINVSFNELDTDLSKLAGKENQTIYVYSNEGNRAEKLVKVLSEKGFKQAKYLKDKMTILEDGTFTLGK